MMKPWFLCLVLISAVLVLRNVEAAQTQKFISYEVLNPCNRPGGPHPGCPGTPLVNPRRTPANPYTRGCSNIQRCRT
ncbi:hypothetical protein RHGRI_036023 [Rhododendron griersonianum]|uniref:Uncharacterized protein n=1 Tax=Rhododendron griersonianum TaxID=479676 RepID=A0AAV6HQK7_9ERIC|nr:hypothetical protein RHGRI_036023 [Rhododendron griersonianum]